MTADTVSRQIFEAFNAGRLEVAESLASGAVERQPASADALHFLGLIARRRNRWDEAIVWYQRALQAVAAGVDASPILNNLGNALVLAGREREAVDVFRQALAVRPAFAAAAIGLGDALRKLGRLDEAEQVLATVAAAHPRAADAHNNLGTVYQAQGRTDPAARSFRAAIDADGAHKLAHYNLGCLLSDCNVPDEARTHLNAALAIDPAYDDAAAALLRLTQATCAWDESEPLEARARRTVAEGGAVTPLAFVTQPSTGAEQLRCASLWTKRRYGHVRPLPPAPPPGGGRLRIGYLSSDFHSHATAYLMAEVFELHDRAGFEVVAFSAGPDDGGPMRRRLLAAFDRFIDVSAMDDQAAAECVRREGIHLLVDLKGYTRDSRTGILAWRPAPIQVQYLGFPGTLGADFVDYAIVDPFVVPPERRGDFTERLARLPHSYQCNDRRRAIGPRPSRAACGLPDDAVVLCCFNYPYKIRRPVFDAWCRILQRVPSAVLWLLRPNAEAEANLLRAAERNGIAPQRLVFADVLSLPEHLGRLQNADLFLDTFPTNAHTTASDALWAGVPVLTLAGETFVSRVAGSLLHAADLADLVVADVTAYEALACRLATDAAERAALRERVARARETSPLFDTPRFTRDLETLYRRMMDRHRAGLAPADLEPGGEVAAPQDTAAAAAPAEGSAEERLARAAAAAREGRLTEAHELLRGVVAALPARPDAWTLHATVLRGLGERAGARQACERALSADPGYGDAHNTLGNILRDVGLLDEALHHYDEARRLRPDSAPIAVNRGAVLADLGRHDAAVAAFDEALALTPKSAEARWNRGLSRLALGDLPGGFDDYEWRFQRGRPVPRAFAEPAWDGAPLDGRTLLVHAEQGYGDALQFLRFVPALAGAGARVVLEVQRPLVRLLAGMPGVAAVVAAGDPLPPFDAHVPLLSLPRVTGATLASLPAARLDLAVPAALRAAWDARLAAHGAVLRVGLVWAGNPGVRNDAARSPRLDGLRPLLDVPGVRYFALQKGDGLADLPARLPDNLTVLDPLLGDFADTAAALLAMDLVITSDTSVAHLAGALGVRAWVVLSTQADWRWIGSPDHARWYPCLRLFRQRAAGDWADVARRLRAALEQRLADGRDDDAVLRRAFAAYGAGRRDEAADLCERSLDALPRRADAWALTGVVARARGEGWRAAAAYRQALGVDPGYADAHMNLGNLAKAEGRFEEAVAAYRSAVAIRPDFAAAWTELSDALRQHGDTAAAIEAATQALTLRPEDGAALNNLGAALSADGRKEEAAAVLRRAVARVPDAVEGGYNLGVVLHDLNHDTEAGECFRQVLVRSPDHVGARYNLAVVLQQATDYAGADAAYREVLARAPEHGGALANLAAICHLKGRYEEALSLRRRFLAGHPDHLATDVQARFLAMKCCEWDVLEDMPAFLARAMAAARDGEALATFPFLSFPGGMSEADHLTLARRVAQEVERAVQGQPPLAPAPVRPAGGHLRIGYASSDFHNHATLHLMRGLFRRHDRSRFEIYAYSWGPDDGSSYRREVMADVDVFHHLAGRRPREIAEQIRRDGIDILVDLKGYTQDSKPEIFAWRPAPVQVQYLGYPGTLGADFIDYVVTDRIVTPPDQQPHYAERFAYLPHCYQINDNTQAIAPERPSRAACGLPDGAVVLACFCTHYKIEPDAFGCWMDILRAVPDSVLWLMAAPAAAMERLRRQAAVRGVDPARLVFGPSMAKDQHLARLSNADLFLDTFYYNGHTTASDALWAGVPVLTLPGDSFASRVGASIVSATTLPDLIAADRADYVRRGIELGRHPERLAALRRELAARRLDCPLFDTDAFARDLDALYLRIWDEHLATTATSPA